jgi:hypothetical protein
MRRGTTKATRGAVTRKHGRNAANSNRERLPRKDDVAKDEPLKTDRQTSER